MNIEDIYVGLTGNDGLGDKIRNAFIKVNDNFDSLVTEVDNKSNIGHTHSISAIYGLSASLYNISVLIDDLTTSVNQLNQQDIAFQQSLDVINQEIDTINSIISNLPPSTFTEDLKVTLSGGKSFGKYTNGQIIPSTGMTVMELIKDSVTELIAPTLTLSLNYSSPNLEVGQTLNIIATSIYTKNDAGTASTYIVKKDSITIGSTAQVTDPNVIVSTTNKAYQTTVIYQGANLPSGSINSNVVNLRSYYKIFYGPASSVPSNTAQVRALPQSRLTSAASTFNLDTGTTELSQFIVLDPYSTLVSVVDLDALNLDITSEYIYMGTITVNDLNGQPIPNYRMYRRTQGVPYVVTHRHFVTKTTSNY